MTTITITALLFVIGGFVAIAIVLQIKEQIRLEKRRKITRLNDALRRVQRYLDNLPPQYQPKDMRLWLFSRMIAIYDELLGIQPNSNFSRRRNNLNTQMSSFQSSDQRRQARPVNDEVVVVELKSLFESFKIFVEQSKKNKDLNNDIAIRYINLMDFYSYKVSSDFRAYLARKAFQSGNMKSAIEMYHEAIKEVEFIQDSPEGKSVIEKYNHIITEIKNKIESEIQTKNDLAIKNAEQHAMKSSENETTDGSNNESFNNQWDKYLDNFNYQKKKF